ncbi:MAG: hypothetical protein LBB51_01565, partial [Zoogloeaceae bacterium]|nr:hypothetical protein [Zoogloeaceae bacterium]
MPEDSVPPFQPPEAARKVAVALARAFLAGENTPEAMRERGTRALGRSWPWLIPLTLHLHFQLASENVWHSGLHDEIVALMLAFPPFLDAFGYFGDDDDDDDDDDDFFQILQEIPKVRGHYPYHPPMGTPPAALSEIKLPALPTPGDLADWLEI